MSSRAQRLLLIVAALCVTGGASFAAGPDDESTSDAPTQSQSPVTAVEPDQRASYGVTRRSGAAADRLPQQIADYVGRSVTPETGAAPGLSRRALARPLGVAVHVVPARGQICHFVLGGLVPATGSCSPTAEALKGQAITLDNPAPGITRIAGLVPDGVTEVVLRGNDGTTERTVPEGNAFLFDTALSPKQVEWGGRVVPVFSPREQLR
jgi:hypothetical protein